MKVELNINNYVEFELTEYGAKILNDKNNWYAYNYPGVKAFQDKPEHKAGETMKMQLWSVMKDFGEHAYLGLETFCKNATIVLEVK